jgi:hypothetical protein
MNQSAKGCVAAAQMRITQLCLPGDQLGGGDGAAAHGVHGAGCQERKGDSLFHGCKIRCKYIVVPFFILCKQFIPGLCDIFAHGIIDLLMEPFSHEELFELREQTETDFSSIEDLADCVARLLSENYEVPLVNGPDDARDSWTVQVLAPAGPGDVHTIRNFLEGINTILMNQEQKPELLNRFQARLLFTGSPVAVQSGDTPFFKLTFLKNFVLQFTLAGSGRYLAESKILNTPAYKIMESHIRDEAGSKKKTG